MKYSLFFFVLVSVSIFFNACENNFIENNTSLKEKSYDLVKNELVDIELIYNKQSLEELIDISSNSDEKKINRQLFEISQALLKSMDNKTLNEEIIKKAGSIHYQTITFDEISELSNDFYLEVDNNLKKKGYSLYSIEEQMTSTERYRSKDKPEVLKKYQYVPGIFIPNSDIADPSLQPIISSGLLANSNENPELEDKIISWTYDQEGALIEILLDEETASKTKNPVFIIDNSIPVNERRFNKIPIVNSKNKSTMTTGEFQTGEFTLYVRNESTGDSEFCITSVLVTGADVSSFIYNNSTDNYLKILDVDKDDIGTEICYQRRYFCGNWTPYYNNRIYFNTFERDWYKSLKSLGSVQTFVGGNTIYLYGKMTLNSDWYTIDPNNLDASYEADLQYIFDNWYKDFNSSKAKLRIWRTEI